MSVKDDLTELRPEPVLSAPGNQVYKNMNSMYVCMCMYGETKREMRNRALCYRKELRTISLYIYIYIYREREREGNKKRERRGEKEAPPPETAGESQKKNDSDGVSESENKRQKKTLKVMCFMD